MLIDRLMLSHTSERADRRDQKTGSGMSMPGKNGVLTRYMPTASLKVIFTAGLRAYEGQLNRL